MCTASASRRASDRAALLASRRIAPPLSLRACCFARSAVLLRAGLYARAEQTLYEATSLVDEPHEAYRGLALVATQQGRWGEAVAHWKNCLFLAPKGSPGESEYLQRLGALLILDGSVNEGRHYLSRAVSQWQRGAGTPGRRGGGSPSESTPSEGLGQMYSWMVTYLLGTLDMDWQPPGQLPAAGAGASATATARTRLVLG